MLLSLYQKANHFIHNRITDGSNSVGYRYADVAELADALDLGSSGRPCRFNSCHPHFLFAETMS